MEHSYQLNQEMLNDPYDPWLLLSKRGIDRRVIDKYREPVIN